MPRSSDSEARRIDQIDIIPETPHSHGRDGSDGDRASETAPVPAWVIGLPSVVALSYLFAALVFGPQIFDTGASSFAGLFAMAALAGLLLVSLWGTVCLFDDASRERHSDDHWQPNPWLYLAGGASALLTVPVVELATGAVTTGQPVPYLFGNAVVALPLASLVAGPAYLLVRWRVRSSA